MIFDDLVNFVGCSQHSGGLRCSEAEAITATLFITLRKSMNMENSVLVRAAVAWRTYRAH